MQQHHAIVSQLSRRVADFYSRSIPFRIYHGNTNSTRKSARTTANSLDVSSLNRILSINPSTKTCICEPNVPMDKLLSATIKHNLMPPVVPEFPGITVGGAFSGTGGESSSFKYGFFDRSVTGIEMILADGTVTKADATSSNADLFHGAASTFGTLGVLTMLHLKLIPCKPFVELTYRPVNSISAAVNTISSFMPAITTPTAAATTTASATEEPPVDFMDGVMFTPDQGVVMTGRFSDGHTDSDSTGRGENPAVTTFHKPSDEWFYLHAQKHSKPPAAAAASANAATPHRDLIPLESYIFRFDRGAFWMGRFGFEYFLAPFTRTMRRIVDRFMHTRTLYNGLHSSGLTEDFIIQDMAVPASKMAEFSDWLDKDREAGGGGCGEIYPRWLCPLMDHPKEEQKAAAPEQQDDNGGLVQAVTDFTINPRLPKTKTTTAANSDGDNASSGADYLLNIGVWGPLSSSVLKPSFGLASRTRSSSNPWTMIQVNRAIERKLAQLQGRKWLYAQTFYTEDEFWRIYDEDRGIYEALRKKYRAEGRLPTVYDKVGPASPALHAQIRHLLTLEERGGGGGGEKSVPGGLQRDGRSWSVKDVWPMKGLYGLASVLRGGDYLRKKTAS